MRIVLLTLSLALVPAVLFAQEQGDTIWTRTYGWIEHDVGHDVQQTDDGGYIITGYGDRGNLYDLLLIKTDDRGELLWERVHSGPYATIQYGEEVHQTADGGYIVAGTETSPDGDYDLPGWWERQKGGRRWTYYRANSLSRNVPQINRQIQDPMARASFIKTEVNTSAPFVLVDLNDAYNELAEKVTRGVAIVRNRRAVLVQDEFELKGTCETAWGMTTDAEIDVKDAGVAVLTLDGKKLVASVLSPAGAVFTVESAVQKPPQNPNTGIDRLMVRVPDAKGSVRVAVLLSPVWPGDAPVKTVKVKPLAEW